MTSKAKTAHAINPEKLKDFDSMPERYISANRLATLSGVSAVAVAKNKTLTATKVSGKYDLENPAVQYYIQGTRKAFKGQRSPAKKKAAAKERKRINFQTVKPPELEEDDFSNQGKSRIDLDPITTNQNEKIRESLELSRERKIKLRIENLKNKKDLVPLILVKQYILTFAGNLSSNLKPVGARVARGNKSLKDNIDLEITSAINTAFDSTIRTLEKLDFKDVDELRELVENN